MESERNLMTTTEAAKYLGLRPSYLYNLMMRRAIPYYKPNGKLCFFAREDLDAWLRRVRVKSQDEIYCGSGFREQGTEKERGQVRNRREGADYSGLPSRLFPLRGRFHPGNGGPRNGGR